jgi:N-acetylglutamate synthase-like GNAT family acetyltransferase
MIRKCRPKDFQAIHSIINDAATAYKSVIPSDRYHEPYMSEDELSHEIEDGVVFWGYEEGGTLVGVMGIQDVKDVTLIRHAYVRTAHRGRGIGGILLEHLLSMAKRPVLIGTWAAATWAISFYEKYGFKVVSHEEKERLLRTYWNIPERQVETSVVMSVENIVLADKALRKKAFIIVAAMIVVGALGIYLVNSYMDSLNALFFTDPKLARIKARALVLWSLRGGGLFIAVLSGYFIHIGIKIIRIGKYPWPGMRVMRDTRILRGRMARVLGYIIILLTSVLLVCAVLLGWYYPYKIMDKTGNCRLYN